MLFDPPVQLSSLLAHRLRPSADPAPSDKGGMTASAYYRVFLLPRSIRGAHIDYERLHDSGTVCNPPKKT